MFLSKRRFKCNTSVHFLNHSMWNPTGLLTRPSYVLFEVVTADNFRFRKNGAQPKCLTQRLKALSRNGLQRHGLLAFGLSCALYYCMVVGRLLSGLFLCGAAEYVIVSSKNIEVPCHAGSFDKYSNRFESHAHTL